VRLNARDHSRNMAQRRTKGRSRTTRPDRVPETTGPSAVPGITGPSAVPATGPNAVPTTGPNAVPKTAGPSRKGWRVLLAAKGWQVLLAAVVSGICFVLGSYLKTSDTTATSGGNSQAGGTAVANMPSPAMTSIAEAPVSSPPGVTYVFRGTTEGLLPQHAPKAQIYVIALSRGADPHRKLSPRANLKPDGEWEVRWPLRPPPAYVQFFATISP